MFKEMVPVNKDRHGKKKVLPVKNFKFTEKINMAYVTMHEFARASSNYPLVFIEDTKEDTFRPVVLLGLEAGENLFLSEDGAWNTNYIPAVIRRYPFALAKGNDSEEDRYVVCVDESSDLLNDTDGMDIFDETGEPTEMIENVKRYLGELQQLDRITLEFIKYLSENNLFAPLNMRIGGGNDGAIRNLTGCYVLNEERLKKFSDAKFLELRKKGYLPAFYAQLFSLSQIERLLRLKKDK